MNKIRSLFPKSSADQDYTPINAQTEEQDDVTLASTQDIGVFSWLEYAVFTLLGTAMLWAW